MKASHTRIRLFGISILLISQLGFGQSYDRNFVKTIKLNTPLTNPSDIYLHLGEIQITLNYFDGLGRVDQIHYQLASPNLKDIIQHIGYDDYGRQAKSFLPFVKQVPLFDDNYVTNGESETINYYLYPPDNTIPSTSFPFAENEYDGSPLNRIIKQGFPGASWQLNEHPQRINYKSNDDDYVLRLDYDETNHQFRGNDYYTAGSLFIDEAFDENNNKSRIYKDVKDKIILKENYLSGQPLQTYYVYNDHNNIVFVIQPNGSKVLSPSFASNSEFIKTYCFSYIYDNRQRIVEKRIPGNPDPIYLIYDDWDRIIMNQDGNMRLSNKWTFYKYDILGRIIIEGLYEDTIHISRQQMQSYADSYQVPSGLYEIRITDDHSQPFFHGYTSTNACPPNNNSLVTKVYYYDDYDFDNDRIDNFTYRIYYCFDNLHYYYYSKGLLTGTKIKVLDERISGSSWLTSAVFYDDKSRIIQKQNQNHLYGCDTLTTQYNFIGDVIKTRYGHTTLGDIHILSERFLYDHASRLREGFMKIDNQDEFQMIECNYNEIGQLIEKNIHRDGNWPLLQSIDFSYNIRGWLKGINIRSNNNDENDAFGMELFYDDATSTINHSPQFNGNISGNMWWHVGHEFIQGYGYEYDGVNRLTKARYGEKTEQSNWNINEKYSLQNVEYNENGNIKKLKRNGLCGQNYGIMDDLTYAYANSDQSNNLEMVFDAGSTYYGFKEIVSGLTEYFYDNNGNLIRDRNKGILDIKYNHLNLPEKIEFENNRRIQYLYDANGTKLRKLYFEDNRLVETIEYSDIFVYKDDHLDYILTSEGRLKWNDQDHIFYSEYFIKDHLGNVRTVVTTDPNQHYSAQGTDYYPFGMEIPVYGNSDNQLKYNGKELQTEADLTWYDYSARFYDPVLGRWHSVDPSAEKYSSWSPYNYAFNNPLNVFDPNGCDGVSVVNKEKKTIIINQTFYYNNNDNNFTRLGITQDRTISGGPMDGTTFTAETSLVAEKGFGSQTWTITDGDANEWSVSYQATFIGLEGDEAVNSALKNDPTANKMVYDESSSDAGSWNPNDRTLSIGPNRRWSDESNRGGTTIHEMGHSWGLPHENAIPSSPIYSQSDNGKNSTATNGIMSYSSSREVKQYEVQYGANRIITTASSSQDNVVKIHIVGSEVRQHTIIK